MHDSSPFYRHRWALILLAAALALSILAVRFLKRPGAMSVIEAQAMDMNAMKAPVSATPVAIEKASYSSFSAQATYPATVVAYTAQDIFPRVEGWLRGLEVYAGDRVAANQEIATLDAPDIVAKSSGAASASRSASRQVDVAAQSARSAAARASAARNGLNRASMELRAVRSEAEAAERRLAQAKQGSKRDEADLELRRSELARSEELLKKGAISRSEYEQDRSAYLQAQAAAEGASQSIAEAGAMAEAARARLAAAESGYSAAKDEARALEAEAAASRAEVGVKASDAAAAGSAAAEASAFNRYRTIRTPLSGVVIERYVNSGTLVGPSSAVVKVAQIDRVRVQASLSGADAGRFSAGDPAEVRLPGGRRVSTAHVNAVFPSADPSTRNTIVEVVISNPGHKLAPGQAVSLVLGEASGTAGISVPTSAIVYRGGKTWVWIAEAREQGEQVYYCTMHPEVRSDRPGSCPKCKMALVPMDKGGDRQARLAEVEIGQQSGERTEIVSGVSEGDEVIWAGNQFLRRGDPVKPVDWGGSAAAPQEPRKPVKVPEQRPAARKALYHCPMHHEVTSDRPGRCPKCQMELVPIGG